MQYIATNSPLGSRAKLKYFTTFYITICLISAFAVFSLVTDLSAGYLQGSDYGITKRQAIAGLDAGRLVKKDEECRLVRHATDKCAFIKTNCPDEEAGLFSYLSLYYCALPQAYPFAFAILVLWLALLFSTIGIAASDFFCINLSAIASILGMSESMAGVTFLAFGNGSPDVFSTFAAMSTNSGSLAVGELIGAAGFITAVVAGSMALVREFKVGKKTFVRDVGFFIVAASFSMVFLADGALYFWECCAMIGFYLFYVVTVVTWHWYLHRRRKRREKDNLARGHYITPGNEELEVLEEDRDDEDGPASERRPLIQDRSAGDFSALERGNSTTFRQDSYYDDESDGDGDYGRLLAVEMSNSMRVTRKRGTRRNTMNPIRPSLVGALEFRSVLSTLHKSRMIGTKPIHLRRYSDDPSASLNQFGGPVSDSAVTSDYNGSVTITGANDSEETARPGSSVPRARAVSMNDVGGVNHLDAAFSAANIPDISVVAATPTFPQYLGVPAAGKPAGSLSPAGEAGAGLTAPGPRSPTISISPPSSILSSSDISPMALDPYQTHNERNLPPGDGFPDARNLQTDFFQSYHGGHISDSSTGSSRSRSPNRPQLVIPRSREVSQGRSFPSSPAFPRYTDSPGPMSAQSSRVQSFPLSEVYNSPMSSNIPDSLSSSRPKRIRWWPYGLLPCPRLLLSTLFPTLSEWRDKSVWDKFLSVISAPSILLLTITLPVVEPESKDDDLIENEIEAQSALSRRSTMPRLAPRSPYLDVGMEQEWLEYRRSTHEYHGTRSTLPASHGLSGHDNAVDLAVASEVHHRSPHAAPVDGKFKRSSPEAENINARKDWNRWLIIVQIFTAPLFVTFIVWANSSDEQLNLGHLVHLVLYSLLGSLIILIVLLLSTTAETPPKYRFLFCFIGFVVSVAWISTIANEVVGVLKAIGVILGISDAILGLTIFAVGNSLGDLVADITVARLGYPVMALSACFGGPMLNILLGIGVSGLYMTIKDGRHKHAKHPDRPIKYKPYHVDVSGTLVISGVTLLVTLVGLLIAVPLNKWVMSRRIGWGLIILWTIGTITNLIVEITGVWPDTTFTY